MRLSSIFAFCISAVVLFSPIPVEAGPYCFWQSCDSQTGADTETQLDVKATSRLTRINWPKAKPLEEKLATYDTPGGRYVRARLRVSGVSQGSQGCGRNFLYYLGRAFGVSANGTYIFQATINVGGAEIKKLPIVTLKVNGNSCSTTAVGSLDKILTPWIYVESVNAPLLVNIEQTYISSTELRPNEVLSLVSGAVIPFARLISGNATLSTDLMDTLTSNNENIKNYQSALERYVSSVVDVQSTQADSNHVILRKYKGIQAHVHVRGRVNRALKQSAERGRVLIWFEAVPSVLASNGALAINDDLQTVRPSYSIRDYTDVPTFGYPLEGGALRTFSAARIPDGGYQSALTLLKAAKTEEEWNSRCDAYRTSYLATIVRPSYPDQLALLNSIYKQSTIGRKRGDRCIYPLGCNGVLSEPEAGSLLGSLGICANQTALN